MEYSGDLQNMGGEAYVKFDDQNLASLPIENYVYPQKASAVVHFNRSITEVVGYPGTSARTLSHHAAMTRAMIDHMRDVLPKPIIHVGERQGRYGGHETMECEIQCTTVSAENIRVATTGPGGLIEVPVEIVNVSVPSWRRVTYPNADFYDRGPAAEIVRGKGIYFSPVEAFLGSAHDQFAGTNITPGFQTPDGESEPSTEHHEHVSPVKCPICDMNLIILDARLVDIKVLQQKMMHDTFAITPSYKVHIEFSLIYEFFWVCEQCDVELFGWDPCPEVIWT